MNPICLVTPPSVFLLDARVFPALGILRIASVLEQTGHAVEHVDLNGIENFEEVVGRHAASTSARIFGVTATTPQMPAAIRTAQAIRAARGDARIILGGPHPTLINAAWKKEKRKGIAGGRAAVAMSKSMEEFDILVAGDGENAIFEAIAPKAPPIIDADNPKGPLFLTEQRLNELPFPARHLIDMDSYRYSIEGKRACHLLLQLGCPYGCRFCGGRESAMLRRIRSRTNEKALEEVLYLHDQLGYEAMNFFDDELDVNRGMVDLMNNLSDAQADRGVDFRLRGFIKSNLFNDTEAAAMYRAGFRWILIGFESGSERILSNIRKQATKAQNTNCMEIARRHGLRVKALMSIGHPGETAETIQETKDWLLEQRPDDFDCTIISTYAGTSYFDDAVMTRPGIWTYTCPENGDKLHSIDVDFTADSNHYKGTPGEYCSYVFTDTLKPEDIVRLRDDLDNDVRSKLGIPFNASHPGQRFESTMGQTPSYILRRSEPAAIAVSA